MVQAHLAEVDTCSVDTRRHAHECCGLVFRVSRRSRRARRWNSLDCAPGWSTGLSGRSSWILLVACVATALNRNGIAGGAPTAQTFRPRRAREAGPHRVTELALAMKASTCVMGPAGDANRIRPSTGLGCCRRCRNGPAHCAHRTASAVRRQGRADGGLNRPGFDGDSAALIHATGIAGC